MARRKKKINRRVVVLLSVLGAILLLGIVGVIIKQLPRDPKILADKGAESLQEGNFLEASISYNQAAGAAEQIGDQMATAEYWYKLAVVQFEWAQKDPNLTQTSRMEKNGAGLKCLENAVRANPDYVEAYRRICKFYWDGKYFRGYPDQASKLLALDPEDHQTWYRRGLVRSIFARTMEGEGVDLAIADLRKAVELKSDETTYWLGLIQFLGSIDRASEIESVFQEAIAANPDNGRIRIEYGMYLWRRARQEEGRASIEEALARDPTDTAGYVAMARLLLTDKDFKGALAQLEQAKSVDPSAPEVYKLLATIYGSQGDLDKAAEALQEGLAEAEAKVEELAGSSDQANDPEFAALIKARTDLNYFLADVLLDQAAMNPERKEELIAQARQNLVQIEKGQAGTPEGLKISGRLAISQEDLAKAVSLMSEAHEGFMLRGGDPSTAILLVKLYDRQRNPGEADRVLDQILANPQYRRQPIFLLMKAKREINYRRHEEAEKYLDRILQIQPGHPEAIDLKNAIATLRGEVEIPSEGELTTQNFAALIQRAHNLEAQENRDEAIKIMEDLLRRKPNEVLVYISLAEMYRQEGNVQEAAALLSKAKQLFGDDEKVVDQLRLQEERDPEKRYQISLGIAERRYKDDPFTLAISKAYISGRHQKYSEQHEWLIQAEEIDSDSQTLIKSMFLNSLALQDWQRADKYLLRAREVGADEVGINDLEFRLAFVQKDFEEAIVIMEKVLEKRPELLAQRILLGKSYFENDDLAKAKIAFTEVARRDPRSAAAVIELAKVTERLGQPKEHERWVRRGQELPRARADQYIQEQWLQLKSVDADQGMIASQLIPSRERIVRDKPDDLMNRLRLAGFYERVERPGEAQKQYLYVFNNATDKLLVAQILAKFYQRTNQTGQVDQLFSKMVGDAGTARKKAQVWVVWASFLNQINLDQGIKAIDTAIKIDPEYAKAYHDKSVFVAQGGNLDQAIELMEQYLQFSPDDAETAEKTLVRLLIDAGKFPEAGERLDEILAKNPTDASALTLKGFSAYKQDQPEKALELITHASDMNPNAHMPLRYRARIYSNLGDIDRAKQDMQKAFQLTKDPQLLIGLAELYKSRGDFQQATKLYEQILDRLPRHKNAIDQLLLVYGKLKRWQEMEDLLNQAQKLYPKNMEFRLIEVSMWSAKNRGDQAKQVAAAKRAFRMAPQNLKVVDYYLMTLLDANMLAEANKVTSKYINDPKWSGLMKATNGFVLASRGQMAEAEALFAEAVSEATSDQFDLVSLRIREIYGKKTPEKFAQWVQARNDWYAYYKLADLYRWAATPQTQKQNYTKAVEALKKSLSLAESSKEKGVIFHELGFTFGAMRQWDEALEAYMSGLGHTPNASGMLNNLANIYVDVKDQPEKAEPYSEKAFKLAAMDPGIIDTYAWILARLGNYDRAKQLLFRSLELSKSIPDVRYHLGWVFAKTGESKSSLTQYKMALDMVRDRSSDDELRLQIEKAIAELESSQADQE